jgi:hypothetical protein
MEGEPCTWLDRIVENLIDGRHLLVGRCVQHNDGGPEKTQRTPDTT